MGLGRIISSGPSPLLCVGTPWPACSMNGALSSVLWGWAGGGCGPGVVLVTSKGEVTVGLGAHTRLEEHRPRPLQKRCICISNAA